MKYDLFTPNVVDAIYRKAIITKINSGTNTINAKIAINPDEPDTYTDYSNLTWKYNCEGGVEPTSVEGTPYEVDQEILLEWDHGNLIPKAIIGYPDGAKTCAMFCVAYINGWNLEVFYNTVKVTIDLKTPMEDIYEGDGQEYKGFNIKKIDFAKDYPFRISVTVELLINSFGKYHYGQYAYILVNADKDNNYQLSIEDIYFFGINKDKSTMEYPNDLSFIDDFTYEKILKHDADLKIHIPCSGALTLIRGSSSWTDIYVRDEDIIDATGIISCASEWEGRIDDCPIPGDPEYIVTITSCPCEWDYPATCSPKKYDCNGGYAFAAFPVSVIMDKENTPTSFIFTKFNYNHLTMYDTHTGGYIYIYGDFYILHGCKYECPYINDYIDEGSFSREEIEDEVIDFSDIKVLSAPIDEIDDDFNFSLFTIEPYDQELHYNQCILPNFYDGNYPPTEGGLWKEYKSNSYAYWPRFINNTKYISQYNQITTKHYLDPHTPPGPKWGYVERIESTSEYKYNVVGMTYEIPDRPLDEFGNDYGDNYKWIFIANLMSDIEDSFALTFSNGSESVKTANNSSLGQNLQLITGLPSPLNLPFSVIVLIKNGAGIAIPIEGGSIQCFSRFEKVTIATIDYLSPIGDAAVTWTLGGLSVDSIQKLVAFDIYFGG